MRLWAHQQPQEMDKKETGLPRQWLFYAITTLGVIVSLLLWSSFILQANHNLNHVIQIQTEHVAADVRVQFELRIAALKHMAKHLATTPASEENYWEDIVEYVHDYHSFEAIAWLDATLKIQQLSPEQNPLIKQFYSDFVTQHSADIQNSRLKPVWLSPTFELPSHDQGIFIVVPLDDSETGAQGYLIAVVNLNHAFEIQLNPKDYTLRISYNGQPIYQSGSDTGLAKNKAAMTEINFDGAQWKINIQPSTTLVQTIRTQLPAFALLLGISIAILFATAMRLAQIARSRAQSLKQANQDLTREIAERILAQETKQTLEKALLQGQKLQAIGTLAGGIAHDFNNLLYAIIGYTEMSQDDVQQDSLVHKNLGKVLEAAHRGQDLIARILAFSRRQHHPYQAVLLKSTIENVLSLLKPTIPASVMIQCDIDLADTFTIWGDQTQLHQVMVNIINNAVDAMDGEGKISIHMTRLTAGNLQLQQFPTIKAGNYCRIDISDTGQGMDQNTIERMFEPFYTTKEVGKGTGLGLATVHAIIKEHQGEIVVNSQLGHGTTFIIYLPEYIMENTNG
jgi:signal transduction histidine kinase